MLAEISAYDPPILIGSILGCLMFLAILANAAMDFWRNIKDKPTGSEVLEKARKEFQPKGHYVAHEDFNRRMSAAEAAITKIEKDREKTMRRLWFALGRIAQKLDVDIELND